MAGLFVDDLNDEEEVAEVQSASQAARYLYKLKDLIKETTDPDFLEAARESLEIQNEIFRVKDMNAQIEADIFSSAETLLVNMYASELDADLLSALQEKCIGYIKAAKTAEAAAAGKPESEISEEEEDANPFLNSGSNVSYNAAEPSKMEDISAFNQVIDLLESIKSSHKLSLMHNALEIQKQLLYNRDKLKELDDRATGSKAVMFYVYSSGLHEHAICALIESCIGRGKQLAKEKASLNKQ